MRGLSIALSLAGLVAPPHGVQQGESGTITGVVRLTTRVRGNPLATPAYAPRAVGRYDPPATPELHNVLVYLKGLDAGAAIAGPPREIVQRDEAFVPRVLGVTTGSIYCHIHSQMGASIMVLDQPFFTSPNRDGRFDLAAVPPGRDSVIGWHERGGERVIAVDVRPGSTAAVELSLPVDAP